MSNWLADNVMSIQAIAGYSAGPDVYDQLDSRMVKAPGDVLVAYEQASYFLGLAARRADYNDEKSAQNALVDALYEANKAGQNMAAQVSWLCRTTGFTCPSAGTTTVLQSAIDKINASGLNPDDAIRITAILQGNRRAAMFANAVPWIALVGVGAVVGTWWVYRKRG